MSQRAPVYVPHVVALSAPILRTEDASSCCISILYSEQSVLPQVLFGRQHTLGPNSRTRPSQALFWPLAHRFSEASSPSFSWSESSSFLIKSKASNQVDILKTSLVCLPRGFRFQIFGKASIGSSRFPPILHCSWPLSFNTISSETFTLPNSTVSLTWVLKCSWLPQFCAVPSRTLIKLTCTTECWYALIKWSEKAYVTAGP